MIVKATLKNAKNIKFIGAKIMLKNTNYRDVTKSSYPHFGGRAVMKERGKLNE